MNNEVIQRWSPRPGNVRHRGNLMIADAERVIAVHRHGTMAMRVLEGRRQLEPIIRDDAPGTRSALNLDNTRFCLAASELDAVPDGWTPLPADSIVTLTRADDPLVETL